MSQELTWDMAEDIAIRLHEEHPDLDPLTVRFTDLHAWVVAWPEFTDDPKASNEKKTRSHPNGLARRIPGRAITKLSALRP